MAAVTYGTTSCSKSNESNASSQEDNSVVIRIANDASGRGLVEQQVANNATGNLVGVEVFLMNASGYVVQQESFSTADLSIGSKTIYNVPSTVSKVVLVANTPSALLNTVKALTSLDAIAKYPFTALSQNDAAYPGITNKIMMGEGTVTGTTIKTADITLKSLTARFEIGTVTEGEGILAGSLSLVGVWINNFYTDASMASTSKIFNDYTNPIWNTSPSYTTSPSSGSFGTITSSSMTTYTAPYYTAANGSVTINPNTQVYAFQVYAGPVIGANSGTGLTVANDNMPHVILLIKGTFAEPFGGKSYYTAPNKFFLAWITFRQYKGSSGYIPAILPNNIYKIGATPAGGGTGGIFITADEIGTNPPETPDANLSLNVTISPWDINSVTPSVN